MTTEQNYYGWVIVAGVTFCLSVAGHLVSNAYAARRPNVVLIVCDDLNDAVEGFGGHGLRAYTQAYLACVAAVDECVGQVVDAVDASPHRDNTIIVFTSDHGYHLGEKEYLFKNSPWEESCRVPLIIRAPGISREGAEATHPVSLVDIYPTLVDLCGLQGDTRKNDKGKPLDGHTLRPFLKAPASQVWTGPSGALTMVYAGKSSHNQLDRQHWTLRTARWRYIRYGNGDEELYDHARDLYEWENLAQVLEHTKIKADLSAQLDAMILDR